MDLKALVGALCCGYDRCVADQGIMNTRIGDQVCLKLVEVDVESAVKAER